jgi:hypothetical protein
VSHGLDTVRGMDKAPTSPNRPDHETIVTIADGEAVVAGLVLTERAVVEHLRALAPEQRPAELIRAIGIGLHGLATATMRATVNEMENRVRDILVSAAAAAETHIGTAVTTGRSELTAQLDPDVRSSLTARTVAELAQVHQATLARLDPDRADSHTAKLVGAITEMLGPGGQLAQRLADVFDSAEADHGMGRLLDTMDRRFLEIRDLLVGEQQRRQEASRGTAKGIEFEDVIEDILRVEARHLAGCIVERTGNIAGALGSEAKVGDFAITLSDGTRVAVEAKNTARLALGGSTGILAELDRAMDNRKATWALCISRQDAYPHEVGSFGIYGNRLLVVDPGDGTLVRVALRWIAAAAHDSMWVDHGVNTATALDKLERIRGLAQHFSRSKKVLAGAQSGLETVREELDSLRGELLELVDDAARALHQPAQETRKVA